MLPGWLDVNEHMNVTYYALVFDQSAVAFMEYVGVNNGYNRAQRASWVALESHTSLGRFALGMLLPSMGEGLELSHSQMGFISTGNFWFWVGFLSLFSGPVFGTLSDYLGRKGALILVFALQAVAYSLVAIELPGGFLYLSVFLFGICAWSIPSIMAAAVGDCMDPERAVAAFGTITFLFAIGQTAGPALAGVLAESSGSFSGSYMLAAVLAGIAILLAVTMHRRSPGNGGQRRDTPCGPVLVEAWVEPRSHPRITPRSCLPCRPSSALRLRLHRPGYAPFAAP